MNSPWVQLTELGNEAALKSRLTSKGALSSEGSVSGLIPAIVQCNPKAVQLLLEHGARADCSYIIEGIEAEFSLLSLALSPKTTEKNQELREQMAIMLLDAGANPMKRGFYGYSAFEHCLVGGYELILNRIQPAFQDDRDALGRNRLSQFIIGNPTPGLLPKNGFQEPDRFGWPAQAYARLHNHDKSLIMPAPDKTSPLFKGAPILAVSIRSWNGNGTVESCRYDQLLYNYSRPGTYIHAFQKGQRIIAPLYHETRTLKMETLENTLLLLKQMTPWEKADGNLPTDFDSDFYYYIYIMTGSASGVAEPLVHALFFEYLEPMNPEVVKKLVGATPRHYKASRLMDRVLGILHGHSP